MRWASPSAPSRHDLRTEPHCLPADWGAAPPSLPTELVLRNATGKTIATESLQELATETKETCEGEEEGPSASAAP